MRYSGDVSAGSDFIQLMVRCEGWALRGDHRALAIVRSRATLEVLSSWFVTHELGEWWRIAEAMDTFHQIRLVAASQEFDGVAASRELDGRAIATWATVRDAPGSSPIRELFNALDCTAIAVAQDVDDSNAPTVGVFAGGVAMSMSDGDRDLRLDVAAIGGHHADRLQERFESAAGEGAQHDLDDAIEVGDLAIEMAARSEERGIPREDQEWLLGNQANRLRQRFERLGEMDALDKSIEMGSRALAANDRHLGRWAITAQNQADRLLARYRCGGPPQDLDIAIELGETALNINSGDPQVWASQYEVQARLRHDRYRLMGDESDLDQAIVLIEAGIRLGDPSSPQADLKLDYAVLLGDRYALRSDSQDLDRAHALAKSVLDEATALPGEQAAIAIGTYVHLLDMPGGPDPVSQESLAILWGQRCLDDLSEASSEWAWLADAQSNRLFNRYRIHGDPVEDWDDLQSAVELGDRALQLASGTPDWPACARAQALRLWWYNQSQAVALWRLISATTRGRDSRWAMWDWLFAVAGNSEWWPSGAEALMRLVEDAEQGLAVGETQAGMSGSWCAAWLIDAASHGAAMAGFDSRWFESLCDRLDPNGVGLPPVVRAARAGLVASEATRARHVSRALVSRRTELGRLRKFAPDLARRYEDANKQMAHHELRTEQMRQQPAIGGWRVTRDTIGDLRRHREGVLREIRALDGFTRFDTLPDLEELRRSVPETGVALVPVAAPHRNPGWVLVVSHDEVAAVPLAEGCTAEKVKAAEHAWSTAHELLEQDPATYLIEASTAMSQVLAWVWSTIALPVEHHLTANWDKPPQRVWWVPAGPFARLPLGIPPADCGATLGDELEHGRADGGGEVIRNTVGPHDRNGGIDARVRVKALREAVAALDLEPFGLAGGGRLRTAQRSVIPTLSLLSGAGPCVRNAHARMQAAGVESTCDERLQPLPEAETEASAVAEIYQAARNFEVDQPLLGSQLTRAALLERLGSEVLHVCCHGVVHPDSPSESCLEMFDSPLTFADIVASAAPDGADDRGYLAVLSACSTNAAGGANAEEWLSMAVGMHLAGYRHAIGSLFPVSDSTTPAMMMILHTQIVNGLPPSAALQQAVEDARRQWPQYPFVWANWTHVGP